MSSPVICIGAALIDELYFCSEQTIAATSNPAKLKRSAGGVARNIAHQLALLEVPVQLITVLGNDPDANWLLEDCRKNNIGTEFLLQVVDGTGKYASILNPDGSLFVAACSDLCEIYISPEFLMKQDRCLSTACMIIADTNLSIETLKWLASFCNQKNIPLLIEPVSVSKAKKLADMDMAGVFMITPNEDELISLCKHPAQNVNEALKELFQRGVKKIWLRKGAAGSEIFGKDGGLSLAAPTISITDSTGAGDAALAGWAAARYMGFDEMQCLKTGHALAFEVLQVNGAVANTVTKEKLFKAVKKYYPDES